VESMTVYHDSEYVTLLLCVFTSSSQILYLKVTTDRQRIKQVAPLPW
jgi:hypothetical protein